MKPISNHILIKLTKNNDELKIAGITFHVDTSYEVERHQRIVGEVVENPTKLTFQNLDHSEMEWKTTIETQPGDEVILRYNEVSSAIADGKSFEKEGYTYLYIPYGALVLAKRRENNGVSGAIIVDEMGQSSSVDIFTEWKIIKPSMSPKIGSEGFVINPYEFEEHPTTIEEIEASRGNRYKELTAKDIEFTAPKNLIDVDGEKFKVIMLNGNILVEQDTEEFQTQLIIPEHLKENKVLTGVIKFIGSPNTQYHDEFDSKGNVTLADLPDTKFDVKVGDRIAFDKYADLDLEYETHRTFMGTDKRFVRMQRNKILCKL